MYNAELEEEERRYQESAGRGGGRTLDSGVLSDPVRLLRPRPALEARRDETISEAARRMAEGRQGCVVVVEKGRLVGILTERDVITRVLASGKDPKTVRVGDAMTSPPERLSLDDTLGFALHKMSVGHFRHLPLVDAQDRPVGLITQQEGVRYLAGFFPAEVINHPPRSVEQRPPRNRYGG
jgi:signal-transduction protein with cAMP-binding, CBS, and nucleotidyltransferase domain